jgi:sulfate transport system permease protein
MVMRFRSYSVLPGFGPTLGFSLLYLGLMVLLPISALVLFSVTNLSASEFWQVVSSPRVVASFKLSFLAALLAALINSLFGLILAWILVRYEFPGRRLIDTLIDLPFAMPTAVSGIALCAIFAGNGWIGQWLKPLGIELAYNPAGIVIALTFIGLPFVVRTLQPVLKESERELEEAAASLGANRLQTFVRIIWPSLVPALLTGFALAFSRAIGEYGSVIFIAGNLPMVSEIAPLMIMSHLEEYDYAGASAIAVVMLTFSFILLLLINKLQAWSWQRIGGVRA